MMRDVVFDSFAILAWLNGESGAEFVRELVDQVVARERDGAICSINLGEVFYITAHEHGLAQAEIRHEELLQLPWSIVPATNDLVWRAARLKAAHRMSYGDCFVLACAQERQAAMVTNDPELRKAAGDTAVLWQAD